MFGQETFGETRSRCCPSDGSRSTLGVCETFMAPADMAAKTKKEMAQWRKNRMERVPKRWECGIGSRRSYEPLERTNWLARHDVWPMKFLLCPAMVKNIAPNHCTKHRSNLQNEPPGPVSPPETPPTDDRALALLCRFGAAQGGMGGSIPYKTGVTLGSSVVRGHTCGHKGWRLR